MPQSSGDVKRKRNQGRAGTSLLSVMIGGGLTAAYYVTLFALKLPADHTIVRYTMGHWIEWVEVTFFFWGMSDLAIRYLSYFKEQAALRHTWLPASTGPIPASEAETVLDELSLAPRSYLSTFIGRRLWNAVTDVIDRRASDHLDEYMRDLADQDADESHSSFALARVIAWAIPILGFLGTVMGITLAIANITPSQLEESLPEVTGGLAVAFDTTALALTLSMILIFFMFVVERVAAGVLSHVDSSARRWLGNRFLKSSPESTPYLAAVHAASEQVVRFTQTLVERQAELWWKAIAGVHERIEQVSARRDAAIAETIQHFAQQWQRDTTSLERSQQQMAEVQAQLLRIADLLVQRSGEEKALITAQDRLAENLRMLRSTQSFDEALHSLTAAVHLLTIRANGIESRPVAKSSGSESTDIKREHRAA